MPGKATSIRSSDGGEFNCYLVVPETDDPTRQQWLLSFVDRMLWNMSGN